MHIRGDPKYRVVGKQRHRLYNVVEGQGSKPPDHLVTTLPLILWLCEAKCSPPVPVGLLTPRTAWRYGYGLFSDKVQQWEATFSCYSGESETQSEGPSWPKQNFGPQIWNLQTLVCSSLLEISQMGFQQIVILPVFSVRSCELWPELADHSGGSSPSQRWLLCQRMPGWYRDHPLVLIAESRSPERQREAENPLLLE